MAEAHQTWTEILTTEARQTRSQILTTENEQIGALFLNLLKAKGFDEAQLVGGTKVEVPEKEAQAAVDCLCEHLPGDFLVPAHVRYLWPPHRIRREVAGVPTGASLVYRPSYGHFALSVALGVFVWYAATAIYSFGESFALGLVASVLYGLAVFSFGRKGI